MLHDANFYFQEKLTKLFLDENYYNNKTQIH